MTSRYGVDSVIDFNVSGSRPYKSTEAVSQREQLKSMVLKKYMNLYGKKSQKLADEIQKEIVNEPGIRILKQRIENIANNPQFNGSTIVKQNASKLLEPLSSQIKESINSQLEQISTQQNIKADIVPRKSQSNARYSQQLATLGQRIVDQPKINYSSILNNKPSQSDLNDDVKSVGSRKQKNLYYLEGKDEDEWASLVKFDTRMYEKEQEMLRQRSQHVKQQLKAELDKQLREKQERIEKSKEEHYKFIKFQEGLVKMQEDADKKKQTEKLQKLENEKLMRDQQKNDIKLKKREEILREKEIDDAMIKKIVQENQEVESSRIKKKENQRQIQQSMLDDNRVNKQKQELQLVKEKQDDIFLQKQYAKVLDDQDQLRQNEKKSRFDKIQKLTKKFENTIQKDIKEQIRLEDEKMLQHILETKRKDEEQENQRKNKQKDQRSLIRQFLDQQIQEKHQKQIEEEKLNKKQAEIWEKDRENFLQHETKKMDYIQKANKEHQKVLLDQMRYKEGQITKGKMSIEELKQNKDRIQRIVELSPDKQTYKQAREGDIKRY